MEGARKVEGMLKQAEVVDAEEDALYGKDRRGDELPDPLQRNQSRLKKIEEAMASLEADAQTRAEAKREAIQALRAQEGKKPRGPKPKEPDDKPKAQAHWTQG